MNTHTVILDKFRSYTAQPLVKILVFYAFTAIILCRAMGYGGAKGIDILFIALTLLLLSAISLTRYLLVIPYILLCALYAPVGEMYGSPSVAVISALLQTNSAEANEFLHTIPASCYLLPLATLLILFALNFFIWRHTISIKSILSLSMIFIIVVVARTISGGVQSIKLPDFFLSAYSSLNQYHQQIADLEATTMKQPDWVVSTMARNNGNYIIIIGESMRRDHMSLFGYPLQTTPFLDSVNGQFYSNYISTAPNTFESLPRTLALSSGENTTIANNVVTLAKAAGMKTHWLSNQGMLGQFDTPVSKVAMFSDTHHFLKKGDFQSRNTDDDDLLPLLQNALQEKSQDNLYVLHLMGSHSDFCERLNGAPPSFDMPDRELACYLSTYRKTDRFIEQTYHMMKQSGSPFKLFYFSDHGLSHKTIGDARYLRHGGDTRQNYEVPLVVLSDNDQQHQLIETPLSAFGFIDLFAREAGINITYPKLTSFSAPPGDQSRRVYNGHEMVNFDQLADDPPALL
ncbi:phosphoethanolamine transferase [Serratia symbiotica]|nr:phosphoethanolamine transferase [Serratia symbiotica]